VSDIITRNSVPPVAIANLLRVVHSYSGGRRVENILHEQLHGSGHVVVHRPTRLRSGRLTLLFASATHASAAVTLLATPHTFTLAADVAALSMTFVLAPGELDPQPQPQIAAWLVTVPFQEI
jgi:hypothetical protein